MSDLIWLSEVQMCRIEPHIPLAHGVPRVDDRRIITGIIFAIRNGLRQQSTGHPRPSTTSLSAGAGVFNNIFAGRAAKGRGPRPLRLR